MFVAWATAAAPLVVAEAARHQKAAGTAPGSGPSCLVVVLPSAEANTRGSAPPAPSIGLFLSSLPHQRFFLDRFCFHAVFYDLELWCCSCCSVLLMKVSFSEICVEPAVVGWGVGWKAQRGVIEGLHTARFLKFYEGRVF